MFRFDYRIVESGYDDFIGQNGFFRMECGGFSYGEIYAPEIEEAMEKESLYDWFERMARAVKELETRDSVFLSDTESYNTWIAFHKENGRVTISEVATEDKAGTMDIEFGLNQVECESMAAQEAEFRQLKDEVARKGREYLGYIMRANRGAALPDSLERALAAL